jgi:hypothetical protein
LSSTTFHKCENNDIFVNIGCFHDNLNNFKTKVIETHGNNKYGKEYLAIIEVVKIKFGL